MASKKKLVTSAVALGVAAAIGLGGTFAWQSINQTALNEASDIVNPGGRLHNDQWFVDAKTNNNDIYVENFTDPDHGGEDIYARVRLSEYMEIVMNYGIEGAEVVETVVGKKLDADGNEVTDKATAKDTYTYEYETHYFNKENATDDYWEWELGEKDSERPYFIPTFNLDKDSLLADLNGDYVDTLGGISNRKNEQYKYEEIKEGDSKTAYEVYDGDTDKLPNVTDQADLRDLIENGKDAANYSQYEDKIVLSDEKVEHTAKQVGVSNGLISMSDWVKLNDGTYSEATHGNYWVYDDSDDGDGWVYWSSPIEAGTTTGLLLDSTNLKQVMDDTWYYAIQVTAQFVTADDLGTPGEDENGTGATGFYKDGETVSDAAKDFLEEIGVDVDGTGADEDDEGDSGLKLSGEFVKEGENLYLLCDVRLDGEAVTENLENLTFYPYTEAESGSFGMIGGSLATVEEGKLKIDVTDALLWMFEDDYDHCYINAEYLVNEESGQVKYTSDKIRLDYNDDVTGGGQTDPDGDLSVVRSFPASDVGLHGGNFRFDVYYNDEALIEDDVSKLSAKDEDGNELTVGYNDEAITVTADLSKYSFTQSTNDYRLELPVTLTYTDGETTASTEFTAVWEKHVLTLKEDGTNNRAGYVAGQGSTFIRVENDYDLFEGCTTSAGSDDEAGSKLVIGVNGTEYTKSGFIYDVTASSDDLAVYKIAEKLTLYMDYKKQEMYVTGGDIMMQYPISVTVEDVTYSGSSFVGLPGSAGGLDTP